VWREGEGEFSVMESDSVRSSGEFTVVDMWVEGKLRCVSVSREAIDGFLRLSPDRAAAFTDEDRREFVRMNLSQIVASAKAQLVTMDPTADNIVIGGAQGGAPPTERSGDRRRGGGDRRKDERRKANQPVARERRSGRDRRKS
jgi:hypothetical protein